MADQAPSLDLVGTAEVARMFGNVDKSTITRWVKEGYLPVAFKAPGKHGAIYFQRGDVERVLAERVAAETSGRSA